MIRTLLLTTTVLAGLALLGRHGAAKPAAEPAAMPAPAAPAPDDPPDVAAITRNFLMGFVMPLWLAAGLADWVCHRRSEIELTTGVKESLIHLAMLAEAAVPVLAGMFLEITSPVLALMLSSFLLHEATALWDVAYANALRQVTPIEQHVHDYLATVPLMAVSFISVLHWTQVQGLFRIGGRKPDWSIRLKRRPLPWGYVTALLTAMIALEVSPYLEELVRGLRAAPERRRRLRATGVTA